MFGDPYASVAELETRLRRSDDGSFSMLLDAASRALESFTGRQFNRDTGASPVATERRFRPRDPYRLPVDDFHTLTDLAVEVNGTAVDLDTVEPRPWDGKVYGLTWPYSDLMRATWSPTPWRRPTVTVTAHWGWAAVPAGVTLATLDVAAAMDSGDDAGGGVTGESLDGYSVQFQQVSMTASKQVPPEFVKAAPYRRKRFGVA